jgi:tetratricopeptide (TPR) repeat protein
MAENDFDKTMKLPSSPAEKTGQFASPDQTMKLTPSADQTMKLPASGGTAAPAPQPAMTPPPPPPQAPKSKRLIVIAAAGSAGILVLAAAWFLLPSILMKQVKSQSEAGNHAKAAGTLKTILLLHPRNAEAFSVALGRELTQSADFTQAQQVLEKVLDRNPSNLEALRAASQAYLGAGQQQKAFRSLQAYTEKKPEDWAALKDFAQVAFDMKDYAAAAKSYEKLADSGAAEPADWYQLGASFAETNQWPKAENALAIAAEKGAKPAGWNLLMAKALFSQGKFIEAAPLYGAEAKARPTDEALADVFAETCLKGAETHALQGKNAEAVQLLQEGLTIPSKKNAELHYRLGAAFARQKKTREALDHLGQAVKADPALKRSAAQDPDFASARRLPAFRKIVR